MYPVGHPSKLMRLPSFTPKRRSWPKYFTYKAGVLSWRPSGRFHIHGNFLIILHINSPQKETVFILAEHKMPVALTFRYLWSKTWEDITSASIKYREEVKSNYGAMDKVNSTSAGNRWSNPKKSQFEVKVLQDLRGKEGGIMGRRKPHLSHVPLTSSSYHCVL